MVPETREQILGFFRGVPGISSGFGSSPGGCFTSTSGDSRVQRAWIAGKWAGAVEAGRTATPPQLDLRNRFYAVGQLPRTVWSDHFQKCPFLLESHWNHVGKQPIDFPRFPIEAGGEDLICRPLATPPLRLCNDDGADGWGANHGRAGRSIREFGALRAHLSALWSSRWCSRGHSFGSFKRENGLLLALPVGALSEEVLLKGKAGEAEDLFGPSAVVKVAGVIMDGGELTSTRHFLRSASCRLPIRCGSQSQRASCLRGDHLWLRGQFCLLSSRSSGDYCKGPVLG